MRIAIVTPDYPPMGGGVARSARRIATALGKRSHEVTVVVPHRAAGVVSRPHLTDRATDTHTVIDVYCPIADSAPSWHLSNLGLLPQFYLALHKRMRSLNPDICHSLTLYPLGGVCALLAHQLGIPLVVSIRGGDITANMFAPILVPHLRHVLELASLVCPVSNDLGEYASFLEPSVTAKCLTVSNGCDISATGDHRGDKKSVDFTFGTVATYRPKKDLETVLLAFRQFLEQGSKCQLVVVGINNEMERKDIEQQFQSVTVLPEQASDDIPTIIGGFDALIISSVFDGCPNVLMESFAVGTPVLGAAVGGMADHIIDGVNGLLFEPMAVDALVSCMQKVMSRPFLARLADGARLSATDADTEAARWESAYNLAIKRVGADK